MTESDLLDEIVALLTHMGVPHDSARLHTVGSRTFVVLGTNRNTSQDAGQAFVDGKPVNYDYVVERVVASGPTYQDVLDSIVHYGKLTNFDVRSDNVLEFLELARSAYDSE